MYYAAELFLQWPALSPGRCQRTPLAMDRELLPYLPVLLAVASHRSFEAAAGHLAMSPSAVSHAVRAVESRVGLALFTRAPGAVLPTEAGKAFLARLAPALGEVAAAFEELDRRRAEVSGVLRLNASRVATTMALAPVLAKLSRTHPLLSVEIHTNDALVDLVAEGFDAGVRLGEATAPDLVTVRLTPPFEAILVAAPAYLEARGSPQTVADLTHHNCIGFRMLSPGQGQDWDLIEDQRPISVRTTGSAVITSSTFARDLALSGTGIAYLFEPQVRDDLAAGRLQQLIPDLAVHESGLFLYFPRRATLSPRLRAFVDTARACLEPKGDPLPLPRPQADQGDN